MTESEPQLVSDFNTSLKGGRKTQKHGKRHGNASLRSWVTFVKKVAKEENLSYRDAMMRAKARKDKGEKWMKGGIPGEGDDTPSITENDKIITETLTYDKEEKDKMDPPENDNGDDLLNGEEGMIGSVASTTPGETDVINYEDNEEDSFQTTSKKEFSVHDDDTPLTCSRIKDVDIKISVS